MQPLIRNSSESLFTNFNLNSIDKLHNPHKDNLLEYLTRSRPLTQQKINRKAQERYFEYLLGHPKPTKENLTSLENWIYEMLSLADGIADKNIEATNTKLNFDLLIPKIGMRNTFALFCRGYQMASRLAEIRNIKYRQEAKNSAIIFGESLKGMIEKYPREYKLFDLNDLKFNPKEVTPGFLKELEKRDSYCKWFNRFKYCGYVAIGVAAVALPLFIMQKYGGLSLFSNPSWEEGKSGDEKEVKMKADEIVEKIYPENFIEIGGVRFQEKTATLNLKDLELGSLKRDLDQQFSCHPNDLISCDPEQMSLARDGYLKFLKGTFKNLKNGLNKYNEEIERYAKTEKTQKILEKLSLTYEENSKNPDQVTVNGKITRLKGDFKSAPSICWEAQHKLASTNSIILASKKKQHLENSNNILNNNIKSVYSRIDDEFKRHFVFEITPLSEVSSIEHFLEEPCTRQYYHA